MIMEDTSLLDYVNVSWPIVVGFIGLVIVLAKMHANIETLNEKVKMLFELWNNRNKD
jgi:hypothetical protein